MAKSPLTPRQREVRTLLVKSRGMLTAPEMAKQLGTSRVSIWRDMKAIQKHRPLPEDSPLEESEVKNAVAFFEQTENALFDDLEDNELDIADRKGKSTQIPYLNIRCNLLGQLRANRQQRNDFLLRIGMLTEAPKLIRFEDFLLHLRAARGVPERPNPFLEATDGDDG